MPQTQDRTRIAAVKSRNLLLLTALLAALTLLTLSATHAQTETALPVPALTAQATESGVELTWEAVAGAERYELLTWWANAPDWQAIGGANLTGTSYTHADVTAGRTYNYTIRAVDADGGAGPWLTGDYPSATALAAPGSATATPTATVTSTPTVGPTPTPTPTSTPTATAPASELSIPQLTARATGSGVLLTWEAVAGAERYELLTWWVGSANWQAIGVGALTGTSYTHADVTAGRTYHYTIRALSAAGAASPWLPGDYPSATALATSEAGTSTPTVTATSTSTSTAEATPTATTAAPATERAALVALYNATDGANWTHRDNWLSAAPLETWYGVTTDENGRVTELRLGGNGLRGTIPDLGALRYLEVLFLSSNLLSGPAPELSALTKLRWMDLSRNRLTGTIPDLSALVRITRLSFARNQLSGTIPDLSALVKLENLDLESNRLSGTIPDLSALVNLRGLVLGTNRLSGSVPDLSSLVNLGGLALQHNLLSGPLPDLSVVPKLVYLNLTANPFCLPDGRDSSGLHSRVVAHLRTLTLAPCADAGTATPTPTAPTPAEAAAERAALVALYNAADGANWTRRDNWLGGAALGTWHGVTTDANGRVTELRLAGNGLRGPVPDLSALTQLEVLHLSSNLLSGPILELNALTKLRWMDLSHNRLTGSIPDLNAPVRLTELSFAFNQLSGPIPDLSALVNLTVLSFARNQLSGAIPDLSALVNLGGLNLGHNRLSGPVPDLSALVNLSSMALQHNRLSGPLPDLSVLPKLRQLNLTANLFCLPEGRDSSGLPSGVAAHLRTLTLAPCADAGAATPTPTPTPLPTTSALSAPVLTAEGGDGLVTLRWGMVAQAQSYQLVVWDRALNDWRHIGGVLTGSSYIHGGLAAGATHYYHIRAVDAAGAIGAWSAQTSAAVLPTGAQTSTPTTTATPSTTATPPATATPTATTPPAAPGAERAALVALYNATDGANWTRRDNWLTDAPLSAWYGVATDGGGRVTSLFLGSNRLSGSIPDLSALTGLAYLSLHSNDLSGSIPDLSALTGLADLSLSHNRLSGSIPDLSALTGLENLALYSNELSGTIPDLSALVNLERLALSHNDLSGPIPGLSALVNLERLSLYVNDLSGPIPDLRALANLEILSLSSNELSGSIPDLSALVNLTDLSLGGNDLSGTIPDLSALVNLERLSLYENELTGTIPDLSALVNLERLDLERNELSGPIPDLSALANLTDLDLGRNYLCLSEDAGLSDLDDDLAARVLDLFLPSCTGAPAQLRSSSPAERAALVALYNATDGANWTNNGNWLTDEPVAAWYGVTTDGSGRVTRLSLRENGLSGSIPDLSGLANLTSLHLGANELSGSIPDLSAIVNLEFLVLSTNELSGPFPDLSALTNLEELHLHSNELSGPIPDLSALVYLESLSLSYNQLSGPIPDLSALTNLWDLSLYNNQLSGPIPDLSALVNLWYVELDANQLTGSIPDLSALSSLRSLSLSANQLTGSIPDLSALTNLRTLYINSNELSGPIPDLGALTNLRSLSLSHNQLTGPIPDLNALTNLRTLTLSVNQLSGPIPDLSALSNLRSLGLSSNQLTGPVPDLSALASLTSLSLRTNQLCLPAGADLSGVNQVAAEHLATLNLAACSATELASVPGTPQNLAAAVGVGRVTLTWDAVADAAGYELWAWNGIDRAWGSIGGTLTGTSFAHSVTTDGRNYYYQVRALDADGVRGAWSERVFAAVVPQQFLPPPPSLGVNLFFYQKYANVGGIGVLAPSEISDSQMVQGREIVTGMLTDRPDLLATLVAHETLIFIDIYRSRGIAFKIDEGWEAYMPAEDPIPYCGTFIHELGHLIHFALEEQAGGEAFNARLRSAYQAAKAAGRWRGMYAMTNVQEYWAEMVRIWLHEALPPSLAPYYSDLADYDSGAAALVEDVLDEDATVPAECKP